MKHGALRSATRRTLHASLFLALPALVVACADGSGTAPTEVAEARASTRVGTLTLTVTGVANGQARVTITGPAGYTKSLTGSSSLTGLRRGTYTITATAVTVSGATYTPTPATQTATVNEGATTGATVAYATSTTTPPPTDTTTPPPAPSGFNLRIDGMYLTQSVQTYTGAVPLVAGRDGILRVFAVASQSNTAQPVVRVRFYNGGSLVQTTDVPAAVASVPTTATQGTYASSWNVVVPGSMIQPGLSVVADVDPAGTIAESSETDNSASRTFTVRVVPAFNVRFVPVVQSGLTGTVGTHSTLLAASRNMHPLSTVTSDARAAYTTSQSLSSGGSGWSTVLSELRALRTADGSTRDYYGVARVNYTSGVAGIGYIGAPVSMGWDYSGSAPGVMAHEIGHTFGRQHAPCGGVSGADPNYPYSGGTIGVYGMNVASRTVIPPTHTDLMGYCGSTWISDYTYQGVLSFRGSSSAAMAASVAAEPARSALLVWGRISRSGEVVLEPAFRLVTAPSLPERGGRYSVEGRDANGAVLFSLSFDGDEIAEGPNAGDRHFAFAVPMDAATHERLATLQVGGAQRATVGRSRITAPATPVAEAASAGRVRLRWDAASYPMALVRDVTTGQVLSFARGGNAEVVSGQSELEVVLSDRVQSVTQRIRVRGR